MSQAEKKAINYLWPAIAAVGSLVLSTSVFERGMVGIVCGGVPFGLAGMWYAIQRSKRADKPTAHTTMDESRSD